MKETFTSGKMKLSILMLFILIVSSVLVYSRLLSEPLSPIDEFYAIKGGTLELGNITFSINATPSHESAAIQNVTLWTNISGTWESNFTNVTAGAVNTKVNRLFFPTNTSIFSRNLADGLVFIWGVQICDNKTNFLDESVNLLSGGGGIIFDNHTNTTGDGLCEQPECNSSTIVRAASGFLSNFPVSSLDGAFNSTSGNLLPGACKLNDSSTGLFYCNETVETYNATVLVKTETIIESNINVNYTVVDTCRFSVNRTIFVEDAPTITLNSPATSAFSSTQTVTLNITVSGDSDEYGCLVYTNDTGTWRQEDGSIVATNNTHITFPKVFSENDGIVWGVRCHESTNGNILGWSSNNTISIDITNPSVVFIAPDNDSFKTSLTFHFNGTVNDSNLAACKIFLNTTNGASWTNWTAETHNESITSMTTNTVFNFSEKTFAADNNVQWTLGCNDSAGNIGFASGNRTVQIDTTFPGILRNINYSQLGDCKGFTVEFNSTEPVNMTFRYGLASKSVTFSDIESDFEKNKTPTLTFNNTYETNFFANSTICDEAGNCNNSLPEMTIVSPVSLCTGWNLWSIHDTTINLVNLSVDTTADFVYWWNNTPQKWIFYTDTSTSDSDAVLGIGDSVHLFTSTNNTWFRNNTGTPQYDLNVTTGHNYLPLYYGTVMGNLSYMQFRNTSGGNVTDSTNIYGVGGLEFEIDFFNVFNNSAQKWVTSIFTWSRNNDTLVGTAGKDVLHVYSEQNISVNMTTGGQVFGNWSV